MKTINFLTSHFLPENTACSNRVLSFVEEFENKYKINVICLTEKGVVQKDTQVQHSKNINIYYVNQELFDGKNFIKRAFKEIKYISKLIKISNSLDSDIVMTTSPYMFMIPLVGFRVRGPKILDIRDLVWEYLDEKSFVKSIIKKTLTKIMKAGIRQFDRITVTNNYELNFLANEYKINNTTIIPNGIDKKRYEKLSTINVINKDVFTVTYVGNIGLAQNLKVLINTAKRLEDIKFLIIGDGIEAGALKSYAQKLDLKNLVFLGKLEWNILEKYYEKTSILYAQLDEKYVSAMPSKLYEYASIGLPIIYGGVGQAKIFVDTLDNALSIKPNKVDELVNAIRKLQKETIRISVKNRILIKENYLREKAARNVVSLIEQLIGER